MKEYGLKDVLQGDYCSACGLCAVASKNYKVVETEDGTYKATFNQIENDNNLAEKICPFSNGSRDEDQLGDLLFSELEGIKHDKHLGYYLHNYSASIRNVDQKIKSSSGGLGTWILEKLLEEGVVDGVIHVKESLKENTMYEYETSYTLSEIREGAKSKYYPIELSEVINKIRGNGKHYAIVGIPCFIKSIRSICLYDKILNDQIKYTVGLVCGHLKSNFFSKSIGWELGIEPDNLKNIDFRVKLEGKKSSDYGVQATGTIDNTEIIKTSRTNELSTTNWGLGYFKYKSCEYCDDVLAELADVTLGDAWLPQYENDYLGTNVLVVRNPDIFNIIEKYKSELIIEDLSLEDVIASQAGGFRHRRQGLAYRINVDEQEKRWHPKKRFEDENLEISEQRKKIYETRELLRKESFNAYKKAQKKNDFKVFKKHMQPLVKKNNKLIDPLWRVRQLYRCTKKLLKLS